MRAAGIQLLIADLTNSFIGQDAMIFIQKYCALYGMKIAVAENSGTDTSMFEAHAQQIWEQWAGPSALYSQTYFLVPSRNEWVA